MSRDLVHFQHAHATQHTNDGVKGDWEVRANITEELLYTLPAVMSDADTFAALHMARHAEDTAFNAGIEFAKKQKNQFLHAANQGLLDRIKALESHNTLLASKLEELIGEDGTHHGDGPTN